MSLYKIQGRTEKSSGIYYEFDSEDKPLGEGGMGKVYKGKCVNERTGQVHYVAVKFMYSDLPQSAIEKARREASIHLKHDNLIEMLGFIETESKSVLGETQHYYHVVSELLEGVSLDKLLEGELTGQEGYNIPYAEKLYNTYQKQPEFFAVDLIKSVLSGLMMMHDSGYIHRDVDPTNIMVTKEGHVKLIDFGIAKKMNNLTTHDKHLTAAGQFLGKPEYAAPELVLGAINEQNQTTDLYAVGILLFQCLTGRLPFNGSRVEVLQNQLHKALPLKLIKHKGLRKIVEKATEKTREKRYQSAAEFRVALDQLDLDGDKGFVWKRQYTFALIAVGICVTTAGYFKLRLDSSEDRYQEHVPIVEPVTPSKKTCTYDAALLALRSSERGKEGLQQLEALSENGDARASFLLSRLLFKSRSKEDYSPDSIRAMQEQLHIKTDNEKAHQYLKKAVEQSGYEYYPALFELACDHWIADERTEAVPNRNGVEAERLYNKAMKAAKAAGDVKYQKMIQHYLERIKLWKENVRYVREKNR